MYERLKYPKQYREYSNKTLLDNWYEDREFYKKQAVTKSKYNTTYNHEYIEKPLTTLRSDGWNTKLNAEGAGLTSPIFDDPPSYNENFTTSYDLSYNYFPNFYKGPIERVMRFRTQIHNPTEEYLPSFGNLTSHGLIQEKTYKWKVEHADPRYTINSENYDAYKPIGNENYRLEKKCVPVHLGRALGMYFPDNPKCNPVTWECPKTQNMIEIPQRCKK